MDKLVRLEGERDGEVRGASRDWPQVPKLLVVLGALALKPLEPMGDMLEKLGLSDDAY